jgi:hypothetical protein
MIIILSYGGLKLTESEYQSLKNDRFASVNIITRLVSSTSSLKDDADSAFLG